MNGSSLLVYIDNDKLLYSKSHTFSFSGDTVDASYKTKKKLIPTDEYIWEQTNINWELADFTWGASLSLDDSDAWSENMMGWRSSSFSANGLLSLSVGFQTWDTTDYNWELFNVNWEDGAIEPNPSTTLDDLLITGSEIKFEIINNNVDVIFSGRCYVSSYELIATNEGVMFYNAEFRVTGVTY